MPTDLERLLVRLEVSQRKFERDMAKASGTANRSARRIENRFRKMNANVSRSLSGLAAPLAAAFSIQGAKELIDTSTRIENALKVAGLSGQELTDVYDQLFAAAQRNAAPVEALVELYSRASLVQKELGISQQELIGFTDKVAVALRVSGRSARESSGALLQLSQALGSGIVRAEEFNSILEGALPIAQAAAAGLEEAGGSVATLRQLVVDGKVSSEAFFRAFEAGAVILDDKVSKATLTFNQRLTLLTNTFIKAAEKIDDATGASGFFGDAISEFADDIDKVVKEIQDLIKWVGNLGKAWDALDFSSLSALRASLAAASNIIVNGDAVVSGGAKADNENAPPLPRRKPPPPVQTVSLTDFDSTGSGSGGSSGRRSLDEFQREIAAIRERTAALRLEQSVVGASIEVEERARAAHELMTAARKAGIPITAELLALIDDVSGAYAAEVAELENRQKAQEDINESIRQFGDDARQVFGGILDDVKAGASAIDIMTNAVNSLANSLANRALDGIFGGLFGGGTASPGGSLLGGLFGFADGGIAARGKPLPRFARGGVSRSAAIFGEAGPEAAVPLPDGRRIPVDLRLPRRQAAPSVQIINRSSASVEPAGQGRDAQGNPYQRLIVRDVVRSEMPGALRQQGGAFNIKPKLTRR